MTLQKHLDTVAAEVQANAFTDMAKKAGSFVSGKFGGAKAAASKAAGVAKSKATNSASYVKNKAGTANGYLNQGFDRAATALGQGERLAKFKNSDSALKKYRGALALGATGLGAAGVGYGVHKVTSMDIKAYNPSESLITDGAGSKRPYVQPEYAMTTTKAKKALLGKKGKLALAGLGAAGLAYGAKKAYDLNTEASLAGVLQHASKAVAKAKAGVRGAVNTATGTVRHARGDIGLGEATRHGRNYLINKDELVKEARKDLAKAGALALAVGTGAASAKHLLRGQPVEASLQTLASSRHSIMDVLASCGGKKKRKAR